MSRFTVAALMIATSIAACIGSDPVHDGEVQALGPEQPGVSPGPTHRPGQPCLVCHGGSGPAGAQFAVGGTIYQAQTGPRTPLDNGTVSLIDTDSKTAQATTNAVGNFFVPESQWSPTFPVHVTAVAFGGSSTPMNTHIGRDGSCASCHFDPIGPETPGHIYLVVDPSDFPTAGGM
jgi:hypothetical protein